MFMLTFVLQRKKKESKHLYVHKKNSPDTHIVNREEQGREERKVRALLFVFLCYTTCYHFVRLLNPTLYYFVILLLH